ncbi:MAG TPA: hypothetical protein VFX96_00935 [Pyrinomonadaceae bacterium]|nr:hypothetical protein [Pyrinomonadaceae bacterium]
MAVVNIPPDNQIYNLGIINGTMHVYNTNNPPAAATQYNLTIIHVGNWMNVGILPGHTDSYPAGGNAVYIQNIGPSRLQVLHNDPQEERTPDDRGCGVVSEMPKV